MRKKIISLFIFYIFIFRLASSFAQPLPQLNSSEIKLALKKLNVFGSALYIAAHPDDENTAVLSYLSQNRLVRTAYLSITRGSGGQNLIGSEKGDLLGVLRTQELLAARRIDGAEQYFTRAIDFGYSKSSDETLQKWNKQEILSDIVWVIRKFKPDIIITRFKDNIGGHGHHLASAILAKEAFFAANDPNRFPEQLKYAEIWQPTRIVWNSWRPDEGGQAANLTNVDLGSFDPLLGKSYLEIAAISRSMHKSQGFGSSPYRGSSLDYFEHMAGSIAKTDIFDEIDLSWQRVPQGSDIEVILKEAEKTFDPDKPEKILPLLLKAYKRLSIMGKNYWINLKRTELTNLIQACSGIWVEAIAQTYYTSRDEQLSIQSSIVNRSKYPWKLKSITFPFSDSDAQVDQEIIYNKPFSLKTNITIPLAAENSTPYWLRESPRDDLNHIDEQKLRGLAVKAPELNVQFLLNSKNIDLPLSVPVYYRWTDRTRGEMYRNVQIMPSVTINLAENTIILTDQSPRIIELKVKSWIAKAEGQIKFNVPDGWKVEPDIFSFRSDSTMQESPIQIEVWPPKLDSSGLLEIEVIKPKREMAHSINTLDYSHFPIQTVLEKAALNLVYFKVNKVDLDVGYIMGSGDEIPDYLKQIGYSVHLLTDQEIDEYDLQQFDAIICGTRAYNTRSRLNQQKHRLFEYAHNGGTLITLHNTRFGLSADNIGPYPFTISRTRVSVEEAPVKILVPDHPAFNKPNKITSADFKNWVQERGLYFADNWDDHYIPLMASNDPGEPASPGGLLYTKYGKGHYVYSGYSWFRQLPAGVPGAYRLFINLLSLGK